MNQINIQAADAAKAKGADPDALTTIIIALGPTFLWVFLILMCVFVFRRPIWSFLSRATGIEAFGAKVFAQTAGQVAGLFSLEHAVDPFMRGDNYPPYTYAVNPAPLHVYFISHDLMLTFAGLLSGAKRDVILFTLKSAIKHVGPLGLADSPVHATLDEIARKIAESKNELGENDRSELAMRLWVLSRFLGDRIFGQIRRGNKPG